MEAVAAAIAEDQDLAGAPNKATVHRCLASVEVPPNQADAVAVAIVLARMAAYDLDDTRTRVRELWVQARMADPLGKQVADCDPIALEVHRAINSPTENSDTELSRLPTYIPRAHDEKLRQIVKRASDGISEIAVLVGGSSTGKTRACWEAIQLLPTDWRLWHPINPSHPQALLEHLPKVGPRTVIWLNEAQLYFETPGPSCEAIAAQLRDLIRDPERAPVLALGTMWPEHWNKLVTAPSSSEASGAHSQVRALLSGTAIRVPARFDDSAQQSLYSKAAGDARLRQAAEYAEQGRITQYLAGGPALVERYETAPPAARALIEAATDARRLGHDTELPISFLKGAALAYLDDFEQDHLGDTWIAEALDYCATPVRGVRGLLASRRNPTTNPDAADCSDIQTLQLADYIEHHGRRERRYQMPPAGFWSAASESVHAPDSLMNLANAAHIRWRKQLAADLYGRIPKTHPGALPKLISLLVEAGKGEQVEHLARFVASSGNHSSLSQIAMQYAQRGMHDEAELFAQYAVEAGQPGAIESVKRILSQKEERSGRISIEIPGDEGPRSRPFDRPRRAPREKEDWYETPTWSYPPSSGKAPWVLAEVAGRKQEAEHLAEEAAAEGATWAWLNVAAVREEAGDQTEDVDRLIQFAVAAGDLQGLEWMAGRRAAAGDTAEANRLALLAINAGNAAAAIRLMPDGEETRHKRLQLMKYGLTIEGNASPPW